MCRQKITQTLVEQTRCLMQEFSNFEIAQKLKISLSTVKRIIREQGFMRTRSETEAIRRRTRKELVRAERRRAIFGFDQKTEIKVFTNRERNTLKYCLKRKRYKFLKRGDNTAYYDENTARHPPYEERGRKLGLKFKQFEPELQYQV